MHYDKLRLLGHKQDKFTMCQKALIQNCGHVCRLRRFAICVLGPSHMGASLAHAIFAGLRSRLCGYSSSGPCSGAWWVSALGLSAGLGDS
eukprot:11240469-Alexandrium_andersonii.AAC.2